MAVLLRLPIYIDSQPEPVLALAPEPLVVPVVEPVVEPEAAERRPMILHTTGARDEVYPADALVYPRWALKPPRTRGECETGGANEERPCPWIRCKHHLFIEVSHRGTIEVDVSTLKNTCVLDIADDGGMTLEEIGSMVGLTRERIRQLEEQGLRKMRKARVLATFKDD